MIQVKRVSLTLPKAGNATSENEDAFYPKRDQISARDTLRFALSDGATEGMLSGRWAVLLATNLCRQWPCPEHLDQWLDDVYADWAHSKAAYIHGREEHRPIQWYEEPGLEEGAFATLIGVGLHSASAGGTGKFEALAIGDSCLFLVRGNDLVYKFPRQSAAEFGDRPVLLASNPARNRQINEHFRFGSGELHVGDHLYLMTDALAAWFLREHESGQSPWLDLNSYGDPVKFESLITLLRLAKTIKNDDVTLTHVEIIDV